MRTLLLYLFADTEQENWRERVGRRGAYVCFAFVFFVPLANFTTLLMGSTFGLKLVVPQAVALTLQHACFRLRRKGASIRHAQIFQNILEERGNYIPSSWNGTIACGGTTGGTTYTTTGST
jgi:hypothetical protein